MSRGGKVIELAWAQERQSQTSDDLLSVSPTGEMPIVRDCGEKEGDR